MYTLKPGETKEFVYVSGMKHKDVLKNLAHREKSDWFVRIRYHGYYSNAINLKPEK